MEALPVLLLLLLLLRMLSQNWMVCHICAPQAGAACFKCCAPLGLTVGCAAGCVCVILL